MNKMYIEYAQYTINMEGKNSNIKATIDGQEVFVPLKVANRHYKEIMRQVKAGTLVIQPADEPEEQPVGE